MVDPKRLADAEAYLHAMAERRKHHGALRVIEDEYWRMKRALWVAEVAPVWLQEDQDGRQR